MYILAVAEIQAQGPAATGIVAQPAVMNTAVGVVSGAVIHGWAVAVNGDAAAGSAGLFALRMARALIHQLQCRTVIRLQAG